MGKRGPRPKPNRLKQLQGSWRGNINKREPKPDPAVPPCPKWLDPCAKRVWRRLVKQLVACGLLTSIDGNVFARYCRTYSRWRKAEEFIDKYGETYPLKAADGKVKFFTTFPQVHIAAQLATQLGRLEQELGLSPSARSRIDLKPPPDPEKERADEEFRRFLAAGGTDRPRTPAEIKEAARIDKIRENALREQGLLPHDEEENYSAVD